MNVLDPKIPRFKPLNEVEFSSCTVGPLGDGNCGLYRRCDHYIRGRRTCDGEVGDPTQLHPSINSHPFFGRVLLSQTPCPKTPSAQHPPTPILGPKKGGHDYYD